MYIVILVSGGRYEASLEDMALTFQELGLSLSDLQQFWTETEPGRGAMQVLSRSK